MPSCLPAAVSPADTALVACAFDAIVEPQDPPAEAPGVVWPLTLPPLEFCPPDAGMACVFRTIRLTIRPRARRQLARLLDVARARQQAILVEGADGHRWSFRPSSALHSLHHTRGPARRHGCSV